MDIYGQHDYQTLLEPEHHLNFLDDYADLWTQFSDYPALFQEYQALLSEFEKMKMTDKERREKEDLLKFRITELERARLVRRGGTGDGGRAGAAQAFSSRCARLRNSATRSFTSRTAPWRKGCPESRASLKKPASMTRIWREWQRSFPRPGVRWKKWAASSGLTYPNLNPTLRVWKKLKTAWRKSGGSRGNIRLEAPELAALLAQSKKDLEDLANFESKTSDLEKKLDASRSRVMSAARELSKERKTQAKTLAKKVEQMLKELGMDKSRFEVRFTELPQPSGLGMDAPEFFISPNPGEELKPLSKIASGGELSRIMLALRGILARKISAPVLIFDEVDAGIGGAVAEVVGRKLKELAGKNQVLCVTHLAQIARFADHHFQVSKHPEKGRTVTRIRPLDREERVEELARMLGGVKITDKTRAVAREMLEERRP